MRDPVMCADGQSYERTAVEAWLLNDADTAPVPPHTPLEHRTLIPNHALRNLIEAQLRTQTA